MVTTRLATLKPFSSLDPTTCPVLIPPPVSARDQQFGQWSRPRLGLSVGVRPNSPIAITSVVAILAGTGLATWQAHVAVTEKARALEVRDFLITLFRDASPYKVGGRALSALDWLKQVKVRVNRRMDDRPALRVEVVDRAQVVLLDAAHPATKIIIIKRNYRYVYWIIFYSI